MKQNRYSLPQVSIALLNAALSLEYYMSDEFGVYEDTERNSLPWNETIFQLLEWSLEESFDLGLRAYELETWADDLILEEFKPIVEKLVRENQILGGKLAFLVLVLCHILEAYQELPNKLENEQVATLLSELKTYLLENWQTDMENGIIKPELNIIHAPMAIEFVQRWKDKVELYVSEAS